MTEQERKALAEFDTWARSGVGARQIRLAEGQKRRHDERVAQGITK